MKRHDASGAPAGGVRAGYSHGASDEYGYEAVEGKVWIADWHATILHLLGLDDERLPINTPAEISA